MGGPAARCQGSLAVKIELRADEKHMNHIQNLAHMRPARFSLNRRLDKLCGKYLLHSD